MKRFRILSWIPAIVFLCIIFSFSSQTGTESGSLSYTISYNIIELKNCFLQEKKEPSQIASEAEQIHHYVRKFAHMTEYFLLAFAFAFPLYLYDIRGGRLIFLVLVLCLMAAGLDEYHQSFVDGRGPSVKDVGIDFLGTILASSVFYIIEKIIRKKTVPKEECSR